MNIGGGLSYLVGLLDFWPGLKTKLAAVAAFALAVISAWNGLAPQLGVDFTIQVPEMANALVLALLGAGAANAQRRLSK
jgi:uncharacterized membrane protein YphA (DoxX/SURF4 family)